MEKTFGIKSLNPSAFSIYYSGIDFSRVNIWNLFKRLLPKQIAIACYNKEKTISELSVELGVASCYLEEELEILVSAGLILNNGKDKFRTNFLILDKKVCETIEQLYKELYKDYMLVVENMFNAYYERIKCTNIFKYDAPIERYKWIYGDRIANFDSRILSIQDEEYPKILSCGARAFIFGEESKGTIYSGGQTPSSIDTYTLWARDSLALGMNCRNQETFRNNRYTKIIIDVYNGVINDELKEDYAYLIKEGYLVKINDKLYSNVPYLGKEFNKIIEEINKELYVVLEKRSNKIYKSMEQLINNILPKSLKDYTHGYIVTLINFYSGIYFMKEQMESGFCKLNHTNEDRLVLNYFTDN